MVLHSSSLSDLARMAAKIGDLAKISPSFRRLCSHRLLKPVKILTQTSILNSGSPEPLTPCGAASQSNHLPPVIDFSPVRSKSDRLLGRVGKLHIPILNKTLNTSELEKENLPRPFIFPTPSERVTLATKIASAFDGGRWLKGYIRGKLLADPVFDEGLIAILEKNGDVTDLGCGLGLLGLWLKSHAFSGKYRGCDLGGWKIMAGKQAVARLGFTDIELREGDLNDFSWENPARFASLISFIISRERFRKLFCVAWQWLPAMAPWCSSEMACAVVAGVPL